MSDNDLIYLEHFGVKGMKWGVRKGNLSIFAKKPTGPKEPASEDAVRARSHRTRGKNSGVQALSNKEIQEFIQRTNLETQYSRMTASKLKKGSNWLTGVISNVGKQKVRDTVSNVDFDRSGWSFPLKNQG